MRKSAALNQSGSSMLGSLFQGQSLQARNVARSGMAYLISQINKEKNRHLLVLPEKLKRLNNNADSTLWTEGQATGYHLNPCATNTAQARAPPRRSARRSRSSRARSGRRRRALVVAAAVATAVATVAHGTANARKVMEDIKAGGKFSECHFIEFMGCPGGCIGGGGQPIPTSPEIRAARARARGKRGGTRGY